MTIDPDTSAFSRDTVRDALTGQVLLAPLTTGGNLPFRRLCVEYGARITCSEMAHAHRLLKVRQERVLLRRHASELLFGVQLAGRKPDEAAKAAALAVEQGADYIDLNLGCPIDSAVRRGLGAALLEHPRRVERLVAGVRAAIDVPLFVKIRTGYRAGKENAVEIARIIEAEGADAVAVHGRTREQRYRRPADWDRIAEVAAAVSIPVIGNGDILSGAQALMRLGTSGCAAVMVARGALIKPWLWRELDGVERDWSAEERLVMMRRWVELAVEHWGGDEHGFRRLRSFLELHVSFWRRYVPPGTATGEPGMQERADFQPRDDLEATLMAGDDDGLDALCDLILEPFDPPASALTPSSRRLDRTGGGWK